MMYRSLLMLAVAAVITACAGSEPATPPPPPPPTVTHHAASIALVSGGSQTGPIGAELPQPIVVRVLDETGAPLSGQTVSFSAVKGTLSSPTAITDANGLASVRWTLGGTLGTFAITATVVSAAGDGSSGSTLAASTGATTVVGAPATIRIVRGNAQTTTVGDTVETSPGFQVLDRLGNSIAGVTLVFADKHGGGVSPAALVTTRGEVNTAWRLGPTPGVDSLVVTVDGFAVQAVVTANAVARFHAASVAPSADRLCALDLDGAPWCWGTTRGAVPEKLATSVRLASLAAGQANSHVCGLTAAGDAYCWGDNFNGQLGDGTTTNHELPAPVTGGLRFTQLAVGGSFTCGLATTGAVYCWGQSGAGQLGDGVRYRAGDTTRIYRTVPNPVSSNLAFTALSAGALHACALTQDGTAYCWGFSSFGQAGVAPNTAELCATQAYSCVFVPTQIFGTQHFDQLVLGAFFSCGTLAGDAYCWGSGDVFGIGTPNRPQQLGLTQRLTSYTATFGALCGLTPSLQAECIGGQAYGEMGNGSAKTPIPAGALVASDVRFSRIIGGNTRACAIAAADSTLYCWGKAPVGDGSIFDKNVPHAVGLRQP